MLVSVYEKRIWDKLFSTTALEGNAVLVSKPYTGTVEIKGLTVAMWKAYGSFTPSDRGDDGLCRTIGEFQYTNQLKFSSKSVLIKPIRLLEFSRAKFLLIESTGCKNDFAYRRCGGVSRMQVICCPEANKKTSAIFLNLERCRRSKVWIGI